jgi:mannose/fructose/N-acetylgalactosamine-specific phosphotransferase system component IIC
MGREVSGQQSTSRIFVIDLASLAKMSVISAATSGAYATTVASTLISASRKQGMRWVSIVSAYAWAFPRLLCAMIFLLLGRPVVSLTRWS